MEASQESSDFTALPATHDLHNTHDTHVTRVMHVTHIPHVTHNTHKTHDGHDTHHTYHTHDTHDTHDMHDTCDMHDTQDKHDVRFTDKIENVESIRFGSRCRTSSSQGFQATELCTTEYVTNRIKVINDGPGVLSDKVINCIRAMEDIQLEILDANLTKSLEQGEKLAKICDLNESLADKFQDLEATEPV